MKRLLFTIAFLFIYGYANDITLFEKVAIQNSKEAFLASKELQMSLEQSTKKPDWRAYQKQFKLLMTSWKKTQVLYVAGELDDEAIDLPF